MGRTTGVTVPDRVGRHRLLPLRGRRHGVPHSWPRPRRLANRHRAPARSQDSDRRRTGPLGCRGHLRAAHRGAHLVDPRTGRPPTGVASVTIIASSLTWADIDATAAYVQGRDAVRWLEARPIRNALVVWADGTTTRMAGLAEQPSTAPTKLRLSPGDPHPVDQDIKERLTS
jgi:ApbE family